MNTNLGGSMALMALPRWDETEYRQQQTAVRTARQGGWEKEGRREVGPRSLPLPSFVALWRCVRAYTVLEKERLTVDYIPFEGMQRISRLTDSGPVPCMLLPLN